MLDARDAIIQADANLNAGGIDNHCKLWTAFAARRMGSGASSPSDQSTTAIVTSTALPSDCSPTGTTRTFNAKDVPMSIPPKSVAGVRSKISVAPAGLDIQRVVVNVDITHRFPGDLVVQVIAPDGKAATLSNHPGGSADHFVARTLDITRAFVPGSAASGTWQLLVRSPARIDVGTINAFGLTITSTN